MSVFTFKKPSGCSITVEEPDIDGDFEIAVESQHGEEVSIYIPLDQADVLAKELTRRVTDERVRRAELARGKP